MGSGCACHWQAKDLPPRRNYRPGFVSKPARCPKRIVAAIIRLARPCGENTLAIAATSPSGSCIPFSEGAKKHLPMVPARSRVSWTCISIEKGYIPGYEVRGAEVRDTLRLRHAPPRRARGHRRL